MPHYVTVAKVADLAPGEGMAVEVEGRRVALFNLDGEYYAIDDLCTHEDASLAEGELHGVTIECPRHGSRFDLETGRALSLPAVMPVATFEVRVEGDEVQIQIE